MSRRYVLVLFALIVAGTAVTVSTYRRTSDRQIGIGDSPVRAGAD